MKIKITIRIIYLMLILSFNDYLFYLFGSNLLWRVFAIFLILFSLLDFHYKKGDYKSLIIFSIMYLLMGIISASKSILLGYQSIRDTIIVYSPMLMSLIFIPFITPYYRSNLNIIRKSIEYLSLIVSGLYILQKITYPTIQFISSLSFRNGIRFYTGAMVVVLGLLFFLDRISLNNNWRINLKNLFFFGINMYSIIYLFQSRSLILATLASVGYLVGNKLYNFLKNGNNKLILKAFNFLAMIIIIVFVINYVSSVLKASIFINESSSIMRIEAYKYYWNLFCENPITGIGLIWDKSVNGLATYGYNNRLFIDDIGIIGYIAQFGFLGIMCMIMWMYIAVKNLIYIKQPRYWAILLFCIIILPFNCLMNIDSSIIYMMLILTMICVETKVKNERR